MSVCIRRSMVASAALFVSLCVAVNFAAARGGGGHGGGGHGGGHAGGHAGGHRSGGAHHAGEHHGGAAQHGGHYAHHGFDHQGDHDGYNHWGRRGWGGWGRWGGWAGGLGLGAVGAYAYDEPFSVPLNTGVDYDPTYTYNGPAVNDYAQNDAAGGEESDAEDGGDESDPQHGNNKEEDIDHRAAIQLVLPDKDAHVFLNGKLVPGVGTRRLIMTPELDDDDPKVKSYPFHVLAVWEQNGRPVQREAELDLAPGAGGMLNLTVATSKPATEAKPAAANTTTRPAAAPAAGSPAKGVANIQ